MRGPIVDHGGLSALIPAKGEKHSSKRMVGWGQREGTVFSVSPLCCPQAQLYKGQALPLVCCYSAVVLPHKERNVSESPDSARPRASAQGCFVSAVRSSMPSLTHHGNRLTVMRRLLSLLIERQA